MPPRIHIVAGFIHREICERMVASARGLERELDCVIDRVVWVPGSLEAPLAVKELLERDRPDGIVVFGVQAKGKTKHGEVIAHEVTNKLLELQLAFRMPMAIAIIGPKATLKHAASKAEYVSAKAMRAVMFMVVLLGDLGAKDK